MSLSFCRLSPALYLRFDFGKVVFEIIVPIDFEAAKKKENLRLKCNNGNNSGKIKNNVIASSNKLKRNNYYKSLYKSVTLIRIRNEIYVFGLELERRTNNRTLYTNYKEII